MAAQIGWLYRLRDSASSPFGEWTFSPSDPEGSNYDYVASVDEKRPVYDACACGAPAVDALQALQDEVQRMGLDPDDLAEANVQVNRLRRHLRDAAYQPVEAGGCAPPVLAKSAPAGTRARVDCVGRVSLECAIRERDAWTARVAQMQSSGEPDPLPPDVEMRVAQRTILEFSNNDDGRDVLLYLRNAGEENRCAAVLTPREFEDFVALAGAVARRGVQRS